MSLKDPLICGKNSKPKLVEILRSTKSQPIWVIKADQIEYHLIQSKSVTKTKNHFNQTLRCSIRKNLKRNNCPGSASLKFMKAGRFDFRQNYSNCAYFFSRNLSFTRIFKTKLIYKELSFCEFQIQKNRIEY